MKLRYSNTMEDVVAFGRYHHAHSPARQTVVALGRWLSLLPFVSFAAVALYWESWEVATAFLLSGVLVAVGLPWLTSWLSATLLGVSLCEGNLKGVLGPHELELTATHLIER